MVQKIPRDMKEYTILLSKEFKEGRYRARSHLDALKRAGISIRQGSGVAGRPSKYIWSEKKDV